MEPKDIDKIFDEIVNDSSLEQLSRLKNIISYDLWKKYDLDSHIEISKTFEYVNLLFNKLHIKLLDGNFGDCEIHNDENLIDGKLTEIGVEFKKLIKKELESENILKNVVSEFIEKWIFEQTTNEIDCRGLAHNFKDINSWTLSLAIQNLVLKGKIFQKYRLLMKDNSVSEKIYNSPLDIPKEELDENPSGDIIVVLVKCPNTVFKGEK